MSIHLLIKTNTFNIGFIDKIEDLINSFLIKAIIIEIDIFSFNKVEQILNRIKETNVVHIELMICKYDPMDYDLIVDLSTKTFKINAVFLYGSIKSETVKYDFFKLYRYTQNVEEIREARQENHYPFFDFKLLNYMESKFHNLYYNRKLFLMNDQVISDLISQKELFSVESFFKNVTNSIFLDQTKKWSIKKSDVDVCNVCEFRRVCLDDRIFLKREDETYYSLSECIYNPFISKWSHEEGYLSLAECGVVSTEKDFVIDHKKIAKLNKKIWSNG
jgi:hypothetical protein